MSYYVDSGNGDDSHDGRSEATAWMSLEKVSAQSTSFLPGEQVLFKRGSFWPNSGLVIASQGEEGNPITFTSYGEGQLPRITHPGSDWERCIVIEGSWIVVEGFLLQDTHEAGVYISDGANHNVIQDIEAIDVGIGIAIHGQHNLVTRNYIHDLHMVVDTGGDGDHGAVGIWMFNSNNEVSYNKMVNCKALSQAFGVDGGALEWWGVADNNYVHHNFATGCGGFLEVGGGSAKDTILAYNVSIDNGWFCWVHMNWDGALASEVENFRIENNTIIETGVGEQYWAVFGFGGDVSEITAKICNNIVWIKKGVGPQGGLKWISNVSGHLHENNLYHLLDHVGDLRLGFELGAGEISADPLFVDLEGGNFRLQSESPAINSGIDLGYLLDFDDNPIPFGGTPDIGAYEYTEGSMSVITDLQAIESELRQKAQDLILQADNIAQVIIDLRMLDDVLDTAADAIETDT